MVRNNGHNRITKTAVLANTFDTIPITLPGTGWLDAIVLLEMNGYKETAAKIRKELPFGYTRSKKLFKVPMDPNSDELVLIVRKFGIVNPVAREAMREKVRVDAWKKQYGYE